MSEYFAKYRGTVEQNQDPQQQGRLMVRVPGVTGSGTLNWAMPSLPFAGNKVGLWAIPPVGANVWVEYEGGNPDMPIWSGCFWELGEAPAMPAVPQMVVLKTETCTVTLSDLPGVGGITLETGQLKIEMKATGLVITNGMGAEIKLQGPSVKINGDAFEVM